MNYYHNLITEKSWKQLHELNKKHTFILIGGWAVYLYTKGLKSKDIDFICDYTELERLKIEYDLVKNDRLKKYEIHLGEFDVDIYVPFFSDLGIPTEELFHLKRVVEGIMIVEPEALLILKQHAYASRAHSAKGEKDRIDILALLVESVNITKYKELIKQFKVEHNLKPLRVLVEQTRAVPELDLGEHKWSKIKKQVLGTL